MLFIYIHVDFDIVVNVLTWLVFVVLVDEVVVDDDVDDVANNELFKVVNNSLVITSFFLWFLEFIKQTNIYYSQLRKDRNCAGNEWLYSRSVRAIFIKYKE